ncbi:MAG TPA: MazG family protein, partial [Verrucomicrobiales bacterium]|nr:MazG family protein [Verrucomicrobiales bacterium]
HPHVFGDVKVKDVDQVWTNWEQIKRAEKAGTHRERPSALDGIPKHLPALQRAEKLVKKAR